ncbi:MAG TPA: hypothetical protein VFA10_01020 [Ktedonobacteraceae bacterium]|nr:hypothetical protein [Ktedonobacteraceae bacterium]
MSTPEASTTTTLENIRAAFLLGWSVIELKSRILINAFTTAMDPVTLEDIARSSPTATFQQRLPQDATMSRASNLIYTYMKNMLKPEAAEKLYGFVAVNKNTPGGKCMLPTMPSDKAWDTSNWRTLFNRIVSLHYQRFPKTDTSCTIYDLPVPPSDTCHAYLYLYPTMLKEPNYATVGISSGAVPSEFVTNFKLYDAARRALNGLTLLYTDPAESLIPETAKEHRWWLIQNMLHSTDHPVPDYIEDTTPDPTSDDIQLAIIVLSGLLVRFLDGWDSFLRESFYVEIDEQNKNSEVELIAYEAGRSLSLLSWSFSTVIAPLENIVASLSADDLPIVEEELMQQVSMTLQSVFSDREVSHIQRRIFSLSTSLDDAYYLANPNVARMTDSLTQTNPELPSAAIHAVKHSLNYWQRAVSMLCPPAAQESVSANPPEESGRSVSTILISDSTGASRLPIKITRKEGEPLSFLLPVFRWDLAKLLRKALVEQSQIWQSLILCQQNLNSFSIEKITQRLLSDFMQQFEQAIGEAIHTSEQVAWQNISHIRGLRWFLIGSVALVILFIAAIVFFLIFQQKDLQMALSLLLLILGGIVGFFGSIMNRVSNWLLPIFSPATPTAANTPAGAASPGADLTQHFTSLFGLAGSAVVEAFQAGYKQILAEFDDLNYAICVADPLVGFLVQQRFLLLTEQLKAEEADLTAQSANAKSLDVEKPETNFVQTELRGSYECLTKIFWTEVEREQEMQNVVRAAFGPLGAFVTVKLQEPMQAAKNGGAAKGASGRGR